MPETIVADVFQVAGGKLVIRARAGRKVNLTAFALAQCQADGTILLTPVPIVIGMSEAMNVLGVPYSTLRRFVERGDLVKAWKRSPGRWTLCKASVESLADRMRNDPHLWDEIKTR